MRTGDFIYRAICICAMCLSIPCSCLIIYIIWSMQRFTGYLLLVLAMSCAQLIYDMSLYTNTFESGMLYNIDSGSELSSVSAAYIWSNIFQFLGGLTVDTICLQIAFSSWYILYTNENLKLKENFPILLFIALVPSIVAIALYCVFLSNPKQLDPLEHKPYSYFAFFFYYDYRLVIIAVNLTLFAACRFLGFSIVKNVNANALSGSGPVKSLSSDVSNEKSDARSSALLLLTGRFLYYPVVAVISRLGYLIYETEFDFNFNVSHEKTDSWRYILAVFSVALTPVAPVGYLVIFLMTQPTAKNYLKFKINKLYLKLLCKADKSSPLSGSSSEDPNKIDLNNAALRGDELVSSDGKRISSLNSFKFSSELITLTETDSYCYDDDLIEYSSRNDTTQNANSETNTGISLSSHINALIKNP